MLEISRDNITTDRVRNYTKEERFIKLPGGTAFYSTHAYYTLGLKTAVLTSFNKNDIFDLTPDFKNGKFITSILFKLKSKPAALYQSLAGFAINGVNMTKLQSYPEKNSFSSYFFLCDLDGHIEDPKIKKSLEELGLHCQDFHVLGVFEADKYRDK